MTTPSNPNPSAISVPSPAASSGADDLDAIRAIAAALAPFDKTVQLRILKWTREKLGLVEPETIPHSPLGFSAAGASPRETITKSDPEKGLKTIKDFVSEKSPSSFNEFAAVVAYFYQFEAQPAAKKEAITSDTLLEACRLSGRERLGNPSQTLANAHAMGYLDKTGDRGAYKISTVGENLVAMTLPSGGSPSTPQRKRTPLRKKANSKKTK